jgi:homoserine O-acetyltransferase
MPRATIESSLALHHGASLPRVQVAYQLTGPEGAPVIAALGGISAGHDVTSWWGSLFGPGKAVDTTKARVLSYDFLGGNGGTTGARDGAFPDVSTYDQARVLARLLDELELPRLSAFVGASYGGMVALAFAQLFPERVARLAVISAAHKSAPHGTAWRIVQRRIVELGAAAGRSEEGLALARALAMTTYRTPDELAARFDGPRRPNGDADAFPVWDYLGARGAAYVGCMDPDAFVTLSRSIDLHAVEPESITTPLDLVSVRQDQLVPPSLAAELAARYGGRCTLHTLDSLYGHDAFLKEGAFFTQLLRKIQGDLAS